MPASTVCMYLSLLLLALALQDMSAQPHQSAQSYQIVQKGRKTLHIPIVTINAQEYLPFYDITRIFPKRNAALQGPFGIQIGQTLMQCAPYSFFVSREDRDGVRMVQMHAPALVKDDRLYVPARPVLRALQGLGYFEVDIEEREVLLNPMKDYPEVGIFLPSPAPDIADNSNVNIVTGFGQRAVEDSDIEEGTWLKETQLPIENEGDAIDSSSVADEEIPQDRNNVIDYSIDLYDIDAVLGSEERSTPDRYFLPPDLQRRDSETNTVKTEQSRVKQSLRRLKPNVPVDTSSNSRQRYILPPDLYRQEIDKDTSDHDPLSGITSVSAPLASLLPLHMLAGVPPVLLGERSFKKLNISGTESVTELTFEADATIESYQRPEISGNTVIIRVPNFVNNIKDIARLADSSPMVSSIKVERIRSVLVYRIGFAFEVADCDYRRKGSRGLYFKVYHKARVNAEEKIKREAQKWDLDVIVLDPGHGGKDPGAISISGKYEKDFALKLAKRLGAIITKNLPGTKVVYTRKNDSFVELYRRGQIANEAGGKLFISIHANSLPTKPSPANGFETFILRPGRNKDALRVAERENASIRFEEDQSRYKELTDEQFIILSMAQRGFVKLSEVFAALVQEEVGKTTPMTDRGVKQAGFFVLVGASMPNILFEAGFLSNKKDERYLHSEKGINALARGMFNAIKKYAAKYKTLLQTDG